MINSKINTFMEAKVNNDTSHDFKKLFGPFWFFLYYLMGYPLRVLGCFLDGFVIYWLVYDIRESNGQAWFAAIVGAILIQVVLGLSTTVSAKNLFRGLLFRSVAYAMMFLITAAFAGGSLYSTLFLSRNGSEYAVAAFSPKLQQTTTATVRSATNTTISNLENRQAAELKSMTTASDKAKAELKNQIAAIEKTVRKHQRIVNGYAEGEVIPWEYRSPIINGQKQLKELNQDLANLALQHQKDLAAIRTRQSEERALERKAGLASMEEVKMVNQQKSEQLNVYGLLAVGGNVGINLLSFFIMLGYELFLKFSQEEGGSGTRFTKPARFSKPEISEPKTVAQNSDNQERSAETPVAQGSHHSSTQFFPYEKHKKNAKLSFGRAFQASKNPKTTQNRMAAAQQHINALLWQGFDVQADNNDPTRLKFDTLEAPTLDSGKWECVVKQGRGGVKLEKFEVV